MKYIDALPTAIASKGMIKVALRSSDIEGVDRIVSELAITPNIATHLIVALTGAIAEHSNAASCKVYAFSGGKRRSRRKSKSQG